MNLEKKLTSEFSRLVNSRIIEFDHPFVIEFKVEKEERFDLSRIAEHQRDGLDKAQSRLDGLFYKIPDVFAQKFMLKKPFDGIYVSRMKAYLGLFIYIPRARKDLYMIEWDKICDERGSITVSDIESCASYYIKLGKHPVFVKL